MMKAKEFHIVRDIVTTVIYNWKPFAWMYEDPSDQEFAGEIKAIVKQVDRIASEIDAAHVISRVFSSSFSSHKHKFTPEFCQSAGEELYTKLRDSDLLT